MQAPAVRPKAPRLKRQHILVVNEEPVRLDVALSDALISTRQLVVKVPLVQWTVIEQLLYDRAHLFPVVATRLLDSLLVRLELAGFLERSRHVPSSKFVKRCVCYLAGLRRLDGRERGRVGTRHVYR